MIESGLTLPSREKILSIAECRATRDKWKEYRRHPRISVILASSLETERGTMHCVALDLSLGGARIRVQGNLEPLAQVTLVLPKFGRFPGHVVWRNASDAGMQFSDPPEEVALKFGNEFPFAVNLKFLNT